MKILTFNQLKKKARGAKIFSLRELASVVGCHVQTYYSWEKRGMPQKETPIYLKTLDAINEKEQSLFASGGKV